MTNALEMEVFISPLLDRIGFKMKMHKNNSNFMEVECNNSSVTIHGQTYLTVISFFMVMKSLIKIPISSRITHKIII